MPLDQGSGGAVIPIPVAPLNHLRGYAIQHPQNFVRPLILRTLKKP